MAESRSVTEYGYFRDASQRFEYFIVGLSGALCAYVAQHLEPRKIGFNPYSLEVLSLLILAASVFAGFRRIQIIVVIHAINHQKLHAAERRAELVEKSDAEQVQDVETGEIYLRGQTREIVNQLTEIISVRKAELDRAKKRALKLNKLRNWLLGIGFGGLVLSRILIPYFKP